MTTFVPKGNCNVSGPLPRMQASRGVQLVATLPKDVDAFKEALLRVGVCPVTVANSGAEWWAELSELQDEAAIGAYLDMRDCTAAGVKFLHREAMQHLTPHRKPVVGGWAD